MCQPFVLPPSCTLTDNIPRCANWKFERKDISTVAGAVEGAINWSSTFSPSWSVTSHEILASQGIIRNNGNFYIFSTINRGDGSDNMVTKLNSAGSIQWISIFGGPLYDKIISASFDGQQFWLAGLSYSSVSGELYSSPQNGYIARIDDTGYLTFSRSDLSAEAINILASRDDTFSYVASDAAYTAYSKIKLSIHNAHSSIATMEGGELQTICYSSPNETIFSIRNSAATKVRVLNAASQIRWTKDFSSSLVSGSLNDVVRLEACTVLNSTVYLFGYNVNRIRYFLTTLSLADGSTVSGPREIDLAFNPYKQLFAFTIHQKITVFTIGKSTSIEYGFVSINGTALNTMRVTTPLNLVSMVPKTVLSIDQERGKYLFCGTGPSGNIGQCKIINIKFPGNFTTAAPLVGIPSDIPVNPNTPTNSSDSNNSGQALNTSDQGHYESNTTLITIISSAVGFVIIVTMAALVVIRLRKNKFGTVSRKNSMAKEEKLIARKMNKTKIELTKPSSYYQNVPASMNEAVVK